MPAKAILHEGQKIGELTLVKEVNAKINKNGNKNRMGLFLCKCGNDFIASISQVRSKHTRSCGCYSRKVTAERNKTHGLANSPMYKRWSSMMTRCYNKNRNNYHNYGGRGIKVCERWHDFSLFYKDVGDPPFVNASLDRIDNNGNYEPTNIRWASQYEQTRNIRARHTNSTNVRGVSLIRGKYVARKCVNGITKSLGSFNTLEEAKRVVEKFEEELRCASSVL